MNLSEIKTFVDWRIGQDAASYPANIRLLSLNRWNQKVNDSILASHDDWDFDDSNYTDFPEMYTPLTIHRQYLFPANLLEIKRVDVSWDGVTWTQVNPVDNGTMTAPIGSDAETDAQIETSAPMYDLKANSLWLYPKATADQVTAGGKLRVTYLREPRDFTAEDVTTGTIEPGFDEPFHVMLALGQCFDFFAAKKLTEELNVITAELADYDARIRSYYGRKDRDTTMQVDGEVSNFH